jgi:hypothetical protein
MISWFESNARFVVQKSQKLLKVLVKYKPVELYRRQVDVHMVTVMLARPGNTKGVAGVLSGDV